jgi:hypothetical protein
LFEPLHRQQNHKTIEAPHNIDYRVARIHDPSTWVDLYHMQPAAANPTWYINVCTQQHLSLEVNSTALSHHHHVMIQYTTLTKEEPHATQQAEPQQSITYFYATLDRKLTFRV